MQYLIVFILPLLVTGVFWLILHKTINWQEAAIQYVATVVIVGLVALVGGITLYSDTEIWSGEVTDKDQVWTSCSHSYQCNCRTVSSGTGKNRTTSTVCDTCYDHSNDWDWTVYTTIGNLDIDRIDRRGSDEPPRWSIIQIGDPVAMEKSYDNYMLDHEDTLYADGEMVKEPFLELLPKYPEVYDYYRIDRVVMVGESGFPVNEAKLISDGVNRALTKLGHEKEVNIFVVVAGTPDQSYRHALEAHWEGVNKNDVILLVGMTEYPNIDWVDVITWGKNIGNELFQVTLRDRVIELGEPKPVVETPVQQDPTKALKAIGIPVAGMPEMPAAPEPVAQTEPEPPTFDSVGLVKTITATVSELYDRPHMSDFEYLKENIETPTWLYVLELILSILIQGGLAYYFHRNEVVLVGQKIRCRSYYHYR